jgi:hypothetical protein
MHTVLAYVVDQVEELPNAMLAAVVAALLIEGVKRLLR